MTFSQTAAAFPRLVEKKMPEVTVTESGDYSDDDSDTISLTSTLSEQKTIAIYFCSAGTIAEKLAKRLHKRIEALVKVSLNVALIHSNGGPRPSMDGRDIHGCHHTSRR